MNLQSFKGVWRSSYTYHSTLHDGDFHSEHYLQATVAGNELVLETIPGHNDSYLVVRLHLENDVATGSWQESTNPTGPYGGETYTGVLQFIVEDKKMTGRFLSPNRAGVIQEGKWTLTYVGSELTEPIAPLNNDEPIE